MIVIMKPGHASGELEAVIREVESLGFTSHPIRGTQLTVVAVIGDTPGVHRDHFTGLPGVDRVMLVEQPYKLVARAQRPASRFHIGPVEMGGDTLVVMAGPCAVESEEQIFACAKAVKESGGHVLRGGAYKPRTSPYSFQGLGTDGLRLLREAADAHDLALVSEVTDPRLVGEVAEWVDMLQVGARNMQNYPLLSEVGLTGRPVMLKRGLAATIDDWLNAAEYVASAGDDRVLLCERGIRTFETATRNTFDIAAVPVLRHLTHLPVALDPSHAAGHRRYVPALACAAAAVGADALMIEIHPEPASAVSDGAQSLDFEEFGRVMDLLQAVPRYSYGEATPAAAPIA